MTTLGQEKNLAASLFLELFSHRTGSSHGSLASSSLQFLTSSVWLVQQADTQTHW